jgi:ribose 5-phosphate isomerase B
MKLSIGSDHAGFPLKEAIKAHLAQLGHSVTDRGTYSLDSVDYPDFGHAVAQDVVTSHSELGIVVCGSGNGINMSVNKHEGIRGALCWLPELASLARQHNDANVLALPGRFITEEVGLACVDSFLSAAFEGGRHATRVAKISCGDTL